MRAHAPPSDRVGPLLVEFNSWRERVRQRRLDAAAAAVEKVQQEQDRGSHPYYKGTR